ARRGDRPARRARGRRGRLPGQAVLGTGAGGAGTRAAAANGKGAGGQPGRAGAADHHRQPGDQPGGAAGTARRYGDPPDADRVRSAGTPRRPAAHRPAEGAPAGRGLGLGRRIGDAHGRQSHQGTAPQAGRRCDPHRARRRLLPGGVPVKVTMPRPLDFVPLIKLKLGLVILASGMAGLSVFWSVLGWRPPATSLTAVGVALLISQILAHGMTRPLREMTVAAKAMARGDYSRRVRATSRDEVGQLATAFNQMAADLAAADRQRRELIANVSHELRTPIFALQAVLENVVDGISDPDTLRTALAQTERLGRLVTELLDLSRIDAGVVPLDRERFDVAGFLAAAVREAEVAATAAGRAVRFAVNAEPGKAVAGPAPLHQVVANLLDNAARHSPAAGTVTVTARRLADHLVIGVAD